MLPAPPQRLSPVPHRVGAPVSAPQHLSWEVAAGIAAPSACVEAEQLSRELWGWIEKDSELQLKGAGFEALWWQMMELMWWWRAGRPGKARTGP